MYTSLNLQYLFDFDAEFNGFLSTLEDNLDIELEVSFDVIVFSNSSSMESLSPSMTSMSSSIELSFFICYITKIYNNFSIFCNRYKGILVIEYYNRLETQIDFDHEIKNAKEKERQILGITIPFTGH
jgi:hypothetical protein